MFDGPLMLWVNMPVVDTTHSKSNKFVTGVKIKATGESKLKGAMSQKVHLEKIGHFFQVCQS